MKKSLNYSISLQEKQRITDILNERYARNKSGLSTSTIYCLALYYFHSQNKEAISNFKPQNITFKKIYQDNKITCLKMSELYYKLLEYIATKTTQEKSVILCTALEFFHQRRTIYSAHKILIETRERKKQNEKTNNKRRNKNTN